MYIGETRKMIYNPANLLEIAADDLGLRLNDMNIYGSTRFTASETKTITAIRIYLASLLGVPIYNVGIQKSAVDNNPDGIWLALNNFSSKLGGWNICTLDIPVSLIKGEAYHIVITPNFVDGSNYMRLIELKHANHFIPLNKESDKNINNSDPNLAVMEFRNNRWSTLDRTPVFLLDYDDGTFMGQPYSDRIQSLIYSNKTSGERIKIFDGPKTISSIGFWIRRRGDVTLLDNLYYKISDDIGNILSNGILATPENVGTGYAWHDVILSTHLTLDNGGYYNILFSSPESTSYNCYESSIMQTVDSLPYKGEKYGGGNIGNTSDKIFRMTLEELCPSPTVSFSHSGESCI